MSYAYYAILSVLICWKWGNWKAWKEYYPTILFMILGNLAYFDLTKYKPLWHAGGFLAEHTVLNISTIVLLNASTVILFLTFYSRIDSKRKRRSMFFYGS